MSDPRYTALLVTRGDEYEFRREGLAPSKDNSTAYYSGRKKPDCSTCGETTQTAYTVRTKLALLAGVDERRVCAVRLSSSIGSRLLVPLRLIHVDFYHSA